MLLKLTCFSWLNNGPLQAHKKICSFFVYGVVGIILSLQKHRFITMVLQQN